MERVAVGIGARDAYLEPLLQLQDRRALDVLEVMIDDALPSSGAAPGAPAMREQLAGRTRAWRRLGARWPLLAHGTELGIADAGGVRSAYVRDVHQALRDLFVHWYSEHLCFLRAGAQVLDHFGPVLGDAETQAALSRNAALVRAGCPCPLLLENPADVLGLASAALAPGAVTDAGRRGGRAFADALRAADAGALLDLTNLVLNARNDGYEPQAFLDELPWERVVQVHLAGGHQEEGLWIDSHACPVDAEALALLESVARRAPHLRAVIIERDERLPSLDALLQEVAQVRGVLARAGRA